MKEFIKKILAFLFLVVITLSLSLFFVPDIVAQRSLLAAVVDKHGMADAIKTKKIIFIGGSNVSFGLNSEVIQKAFNRPVINMGVHAGMGLKYIACEAKPFIRKGDVVVLVPEYENFYTENFYGEMELVQVLFDVDRSGKQYVDAEQWLHLYKYIPTFAAKKIKNYISSLWHKEPISEVIDVSDRGSFNDFGDAYIHWTLPDQGYMSCRPNTGDEKINQAAISFVSSFKDYVTDLGATFVILPPVIEERSFTNQKKIISGITIELNKKGISFAAQPERYRLPQGLFFNSYYHPNKRGVDLRTSLVVEDLSRIIDKTPAP